VKIHVCASAERHIKRKTSVGARFKIMLYQYTMDNPNTGKSCVPHPVFTNDLKVIQPCRYNHHQSLRQFHKQHEILSQFQFSWLLWRTEQSGTRVPSGVPPKSLPSAHSLHLQNMFRITLILNKDRFPQQHEMFGLSKRDVMYYLLKEALNFFGFWCHSDALYCRIVLPKLATLAASK
jgi:hypothetical protein